MKPWIKNVLTGLFVLSVLALAYWLEGPHTDEEDCCPNYELYEPGDRQ